VPGRRFSIEEREELSRGLVAKESLRSIAGRLGRPASTLSREVARNGGMARDRAARAHRAAHARARRPKEHKLARHRDLARAVEGGLETRWSPEQIANRLRLEHPAEPYWWVSHEAIYQSLYVQGRGGLRAELVEALLTGSPWTGPPVVRVRCPRLGEGGQHDMKRRRHTPEQII
jgi:IS30 family transposase